MTDAPVPTFPDGPYAGRTVGERDVEVARAMQFLQGVGYKITFPSLRQAEQLKAIDNGLRNGSRMTEANLAFDELCTALGVDRAGLEHGKWTERPVIRRESCGDPGSGIGCVTSGCTHDGDWVPSDYAVDGQHER